MPKKDFVSLHDLSVPEFLNLMELSADVKARPQRYRQALAQKSLAMIFQKPSTRTRVSFEVGMVQLGGHALNLNSNELQLGRGESVADTAKVLSRFVDGIMARVFKHDDLLTLAREGSVPVINGLSDKLHPCQALCDVFTIKEKFGQLAGLKLTYVGDGNNVAHSLAYASAKVGIHFTIVTPQSAKYMPDTHVIANARHDAKTTGATITVTHDIDKAVAGTQVIYTDVWTSMGQEDEHAQRHKDFHGFQVNEAMFAKADKDAIFMHCLPAHRGEEVSDGVCDHPRSVIFDQAENRMHTEKAILLALLGDA